MFAKFSLISNDLLYVCHTLGSPNVVLAFIYCKFMFFQICLSELERFISTHDQLVMGPAPNVLEACWRLLQNTEGEWFSSSAMSALHQQGANLRQRNREG